MVNKFLPAWPGRCLLCGLDSGRSLDLCPACHASLIPLGPHCARCALPTERATPLCGRCLLQPPAFDAARAALRYDFHSAALVQALKYRHQRAAARLLGELLADALKRVCTDGSNRPNHIDAIVPLPLHWRRHWSRGFNQAELIGTLLARHTGLPLRTDLLRRRRHTPPQQGLDAAARARNLRDAFVGRGGAEGLHLALLDDVMTTGASAAAAAAALKRAGAAWVEVWAVARTPDPGH